MSNSNDENTWVGREFQKLVQRSFPKHYGITLELEVPLPIGNPPKPHKFDCTSEDQKIVIECKCYTWTDTGNVPSAKLRGLNEAVFFMRCLPDDITKILCMAKATHPTKSETLAEYYCRLYGHLLGNVKVFEVDSIGNIREIRP